MKSSRAGDVAGWGNSRAGAVGYSFHNFSPTIFQSFQRFSKTKKTIPVFAVFKLDFMVAVPISTLVVIVGVLCMQDFFFLVSIIK